MQMKSLSAGETVPMRTAHSEVCGVPSVMEQQVLQPERPYRPFVLDLRCHGHNNKHAAQKQLGSRFGLKLILLQGYMAVVVMVTSWFC